METETAQDVAERRTEKVIDGSLKGMRPTRQHGSATDSHSMSNLILSNGYLNQWEYFDSLL